MSAHLTVLASLGVAILLSPEILVLGLVMACDRQTPRLSAFLYALGAAAGLALGLTIGCLVAPASHTPAAPSPPTWTEFAVRLAIAGLLVTVGVQRAINAARAAPIDGEAEAEGHGATSRLKAWIASRLPGHGAAELPAGRRAIRSLLLGFATMGVHPKCVSVAIAAGHQAMQVPGDADRTLAFGVFAAIAMLPAVAPFAIELVRPGGSASMKESCERLMRRDGRWIVAVILLGAGGYVAWHAFQRMP